MCREFGRLYGRRRSRSAKYEQIGGFLMVMGNGSGNRFALIGVEALRRVRSSAGYRVGKFGRGGTDDELEKPLNPV